MKLELVIKAYDREAQFDHYDDGSVEAFDVVSAEVADGEHAGERLRVLVASNSSRAKLWDRPGATLRVTVDPDLLASQVLFAGAFDIEEGP